MAYTGFTKLGIDRYRQAAKVLKTVTRDTFTAAKGFDLRKVDSWSPAMKKQVRRYWREYDHLTARPHDLYSTRNITKLVAVQKAALHQHYNGKFKYAFVPTNGIDKPIVKFDKNDNVEFVIGRIRKRTIPFRPLDLADDPEAETRRVLSQASGAKAFHIQCGNFEYTKKIFNDAKALSKQVHYFQNTYENHPSWLIGIVAYYFDQREEFKRYSLDTDRMRNHIANKRRKIRQNIYYARKQLKQIEFNIRLYNKSAPRYRVAGFIEKQIELVAKYKADIAKLITQLANVGK